MKILFGFCLVFVLGVLGAGCESPQSPASEIAVRTSITSGGSDPVQIKVHLEGPHGEAVSGALVLAESPDHQIQILEFSWAKGWYYGEFPQAMSGDYLISVKSRLLKQDWRAAIPHKVLTASPKVTSLMDASGHSALSGESLTAGQATALAWAAVPGAGVYQVILRKAGVVVSMSADYGTSKLLPASALATAGNYSLTLNAQFQAGDPLFRADSFSSASSALGPTVYFTVK